MAQAKCTEFSHVRDYGFCLREVAGASGDIGTFLPLLIGVVHFAHMCFDDCCRLLAVWLAAPRLYYGVGYACPDVAIESILQKRWMKEKMNGVDRMTYSTLI